MTVEAFDLSRQQDPKIGSWTIGIPEIRKHWISVLNRYEYSLTLPWQTVPTGRELHLEVTFDDELTQRRFKRSVDVAIEPPADAGTPATASTTQPGPAK